jgi:hypothetical protein
LVEEPKVEDIQMEESNPYMAQSSNFCIFTHEQICSQQESMIDAAEDLTARQKLGYELMAKHEWCRDGRRVGFRKEAKKISDDCWFISTP